MDGMLIEFLDLPVLQWRKMQQLNMLTDGNVLSARQNNEKGFSVLREEWVLTLLRPADDE